MAISNGHLPAWHEIKGLHPWDAILIGNGLSINIWEDYKYPSLYVKAREHRDGLTDADVAVFEALGVQNFEAVLRELRSARVVLRALGQPTDEIDARYRSVRNALAVAVHAVHVRGGEVPDETLLSIGNALREYRHVFTVNYDLLTYWSAAKVGWEHFVDWFFGGPFDESRIWLSDEWSGTRLYFLHGALHLVHLANGNTCKRTGDDGPTLLDQFGKPYAGDPDAQPVVVTEADAREKEASIAADDYLRFCLKSLGACGKPLVIFGHGLSEQHDGHLIAAIRKHPDRAIAVGLRTDKTPVLDAKMLRIRSLFPESEVSFFNAASHPLGSEGLTLSEAPWRKRIKTAFARATGGAGMF